VIRLDITQDATGSIYIKAQAIDPGAFSFRHFHFLKKAVDRDWLKKQGIVNINSTMKATSFVETSWANNTAGVLCPFGRK